MSFRLVPKSVTLNDLEPLHCVISLNLVNLCCRKRSVAEFMQESIVFLVRVQCRRKESSRSLSHLLMSFLSTYLVTTNASVTSIPFIIIIVVVCIRQRCISCCKKRNVRAESDVIIASAASLGGGPSRVTPSRGWHPKEIFLWANLQRIVEKRGPTGKKGVGWHPGGGDNRVKAIKSDGDSDSDGKKHVARFFRKK